MNRIIQQMHANTPAQNTVAPSYSERQKVVVFVRELQGKWHLLKSKNCCPLGL